MTLSRFLATTSMAFALTHPAPALAGIQNVPCDRPFVFSGAAVNVVVLPYSVPPILRDSSAGAGRKLSALVQLESLLAIAKFGSVGAVQLIGEPERGCTPEIVLAKLLQQQPGASGALKPGAGLVMVWGRVFQSGRDVYLQSFLQFLRRDSQASGSGRVLRETVSVRIANHTFSGRLTAQAFACAPRRISISDLEEIDRQFARMMQIRPTPSESAVGSRIPVDVPFSYWITDVQGPWLKIETASDGPRGWILARADRPDWSLRTKMPELSFVEGAVGFLRYRVGAPASATVLDAADLALRTYVHNWQAGAVGVDQGSRDVGSTTMAVALPLEVQGAITLLRPEPNASMLDDARKAFARAVELLPYSADARNLEIMTRIMLAYSRKQPGLNPQRASTDLLDALGREPQNALALANLGSLYEVMLADVPAEARPPDWTPLSVSDRDTLRRQLDAIRGLMSRPAMTGTVR